MAVSQYRKRPVVIEAIQWDGLNLEEIKDFAGEAVEYEIVDAAYRAGVAPPYVDMRIRTLEGDHRASVGDFIIKGVRGEFYPCKPDVFEVTYEQAEEEAE